MQLPTPAVQLRTREECGGEGSHSPTRRTLARERENRHGGKEQGDEQLSRLGDDTRDRGASDHEETDRQVHLWFGRGEAPRDVGHAEDGHGGGRGYESPRGRLHRERDQVLR